MQNVQKSVEINDLSLSYGSVEVLKGLNLDIAEGEFLVLLGSSGCGKSTLLNCIAGLTDVTQGQIFINNRNVTWLEPSRRGIGMVFQSYALYPQMSVRQNLSFGLENAKLPRRDIADQVSKTAKVLQIESLLDRKPSQLSGGQRQRVAIGRALVREVDVFLFDEPLSNLDAKLRAALRVEIKRLHQELTNTMIYVTHDQIEAMTLADRIAIMRNGTIQQLGSPDQIYLEPKNLYVAEFIGSPTINLFEGVLDEGHFKSKELSMEMANYPFKSQADKTGPAVLGLRPEHLLVGALAEAANIQHEVEIELVEPMGAETLLWSTVNDKPFCIRTDGKHRASVGDIVKVGFDTERALLFDPKSEMRI